MVWIVANGAPKTGSTWVVELVGSFPGVEPVPMGYRSEWAWPSVREDAAEEAASELGSSRKYYWSKQHWVRQALWLLGPPGVRVINSIRDVRDTVVSRYHHDLRLGVVPQMEMGEYLALRGRMLVAAFCNYHRAWLDAPGMTAQNYHVVSYEGLHHDLHGAAVGLAVFCDIAATRESIAAVAEGTRFEAHKVRGAGTFYRKGEVGAWGEDMTEAQGARVLGWAVEHGLDDIKARLAAFAPSLAPYLAMTDVGLGS